mmetsp:Transcript_14588/g.40220  ORF Transcript_14588/g.40220 Transcript_14588/m.40220 type:complete len:237 (-) Transcript_14588:1488-2198(-)
MKFQQSALIAAIAVSTTMLNVAGFNVNAARSLQRQTAAAFVAAPSHSGVRLYNTAGDEDGAITFSSPEEKEELVGNLVTDDEWNGLGMELSNTIQSTIDDIQQKTNDFTGSEEYKIGDVSKEIDRRVKEGISSMREKDEYELGDFILAMDEMSKSMVEEMTGKPYESGDLTVAIDQNIKDKIGEFTGTEYEVGDITRAIDSRVKDKIGEFTGNDDYEFGDVARGELRCAVWYCVVL